MVLSAGLAGMDITDCQIDSFVRFTDPMRKLANLPECQKEDGLFFTAACATIDLVRKNLLDVKILPEPYIPVSYTHLTLPTICSV